MRKIAAKEIICTNYSNSSKNYPHSNRKIKANIALPLFQSSVSTLTEVWSNLIKKWVPVFF